MALSRVAIQNGDGETEMSVRDFLALPLDQRVRLVLEQKLLFYDEAGRRLAAAEGLKLLRGARDVASVPAG